MKKIFISFVILITCVFSVLGANPITNDTFWKTTSGDYIYSQGGGIFQFPDPKTGKMHYYWYGVKYQQAVDYCPKALAGSKSNNTTFVSVTCYQSDDLVNWTFVKDVMTTNTFKGHNGAWWVGRLGVAYVKEAKKYALFVQYNSVVGVFTCDTPTGNFVYHQEIDMTSYIGTSNTGDQTVFTDEDGQSYLCYSYGKGRAKIYISKIGMKDGKIGLVNVNQIFKGAGREGDCMFKYKGKYYVCASDLFGWNASNVYYLESSNIYGPYTPTNNMQIMPGSDSDYGHVTQTGFFFTVRGSKQETVIYCGDRWAGFAGNGNGYNQWCPLSFVDGKPYFNSLSKWSLNASTGEWSVDQGNNYVKNFSFDADRIGIPSSGKPTQTYLKGWSFDVTKGNKIEIGSSTSPQLNASNSSADRETVMGNWCLNVYDNIDYTRKIYQKISSTPSVPLLDGKYKMTAKVKCGSSKFKGLNMYAYTNKTTYKSDITNFDGKWHEVVINDIEVKNGSVEVGFYADGKGGDWCRIDDVTLIRISSTETVPEEPQEATLGKHGVGSSSQKIMKDSALVSFYYDWTVAPDVKVTGLPNGIVVNIDKQKKRVTLSGFCNDEPGVYNYVVETIGAEKNAKLERFIEILVPTEDPMTNVETIENQDFAIVPNPATTTIYIDSEATIEDVVVYNIVGEVVARSRDALVDVSSLSSGIYFVKVSIDGESVVKKLVVKQ